MSVPRSSHAPDFLSQPSLDALEQALPLVTTVSLAIIAIISFFIFSNRSSFPLANPPAWYQPKLVKQLEFLKDGYNIYAEARKRYGKQPYRMISHLGEVLILPPSYAQDIRNESRLNFGISQVRDFNGHVPGLEPFGAIGAKKQILQNVVKKQLTKALNTVTHPLSQEASFIVDHMFGNEPEWKEMTAVPEIMDLIARLSSKLFLGDQLCRNEAWLELSKQYTKTSFPTAGEIAIMPKPLTHLVHLFHPGIKQLRQQLQDAGAILQPILDQRAQAKAEAKKKGEPAPVYNDMLEWIQQQAGDELVEPVHYQMSLTFAAIHTTSDLLTQTMIRLANEPHLIEELRKEIIEVLTTDGLAKASLANLKLMDSAMKEAQRVNPITLMGMRRLATESFTLTGGIKINKGDYVMVDASNLLDPEIYPDPHKYDMYRFYRMRQDPATANKAHLVSTSVENISFGHGIHACPGRFFAANEIKIALCHLLLKYDWELAPGASVEPYILFAENTALNPDNKLRYRRRKEELDLEALSN